MKDRSGNYVVPTTRSSCVYFDDNTTLTKLSFYPVGAIYQSTGSTSPASLFGGDWERIQGRFLLGTSSSYSVTATGGEERHTLTISEMPRHNHAPGEGQAFIIDPNRYNNSSEFAMLTTSQTSYKYANAWGTASTGGGGSHNNMPPYYAVNIWRRTA